MISESMLPVPHDIVELERMVTLLEKIPIFEEKLKCLSLEIERFANSAASHRHNTDPYGIEIMIFRAFYSELENRPFQAPSEKQLQELRGNWHEGTIRRRNPPCEICGENRSTDICHIIPNRLGGPIKNDNILILCPTHHRLYDRHMLSRAEFAQIDWAKKSEAAQAYITSVVLKAQNTFWYQIDNKNYESLGQYHEDVSSLPFVRYATEQVLSVFGDSRPIPRAKIYNLVAPELRELSKKVLDTLVKHNCLRQEKRGSVNIVARTTDCLPVDEHIVKRIWQQVS